MSTKNESSANHSHNIRELDGVDLPLEPTARLFKTLAHEGRLRILLSLAREGALHAGAIQEDVGLEQSALSHQLRILRDARLIRAERQGRQKIYTLHDDHIAHIVMDAINHMREGGCQDGGL